MNPRRRFPRPLVAALLSILVLLVILVATRSGRPPSSGAGGVRPESLCARAGGGSTETGRAGLVRWRGPVEQVFFHPLVLRPKLAFGKDPLGQGFEDFFVTADEFRAILEELWRNGWTLVDVHRVADGRVWVPPGRKPLVLYEDDANYYEYFAGRGLAARLVLGPDGEILAEYEDADGRRHRTSEDVVSLVDAFVEEHPEFSAEGAKGVLAVTAYEGLFGEHDLTRPAARARVRNLARCLRAGGWVIASHTYGHIDLGLASVSTIAGDTARWKRVAGGLLGPTDILVYPYGARPTDAGRRFLRNRGFDIQVDIDVVPRRVVEDGVILMSRRHIDGLAFEHPERLAPFFSVRRVMDPARRLVA